MFFIFITTITKINIKKKYNCVIRIINHRVPVTKITNLVIVYQLE